MSNVRDGGRSALAGYLYQIIGVLGLTARGSFFGVSPDSSELKAEMTVASTNEWWHEHLDSDAVLRQLGIDAHDEYVLVQFKFSRQVPLPSLGRPDLIEIAGAMKRSANRARSLGHNVTGYVLMSNRGLGASTNGTLVDTTVMRDPEVRDILDKLRVVTDLQLAEWDDCLRRYGRQLGAEENEIDRGIWELIGKLHDQTARGGSTVIDKDNLAEAFTDHPAALPLVLDRVVPLCVQQLNWFSDRLSLHREPLRRQVLDEIAKAVAERGLVVLYGPGGCGKTVALCQWVKEMVESSRQQRGGFATIGSASDVRRDWVANLVRGWANLPPGHRRQHEQLAHALRRLRIANPNTTPPILHLALDGLDEGVDTTNQEQDIREILECFWNIDKHRWTQPPEAVLVVTCRDLDEVVRKWLRLDRSAFGYLGEPPQGVEVSDFSSGELLSAARNDLPNHFSRIETALCTPDGPFPEESPEYPELLGLASHVPPLPGMPDNILEALRHPAMWHALVMLPDSVLSEVLNGEPEAILQLGGVFVRWFCEKTVLRSQDAGLGDQGVLYVLRAIAKGTKDIGRTRMSVREWNEFACDNGMVNLIVANRLHTEACSGGLILKDDAAYWRWRHSFVWDYLAEANDISERCSVK
ncbi:MAG: hypothetical protein M1358_10815 [Chloroflexi bacterium]|nr:hypothetical protein [Chloroflexota bacterium]